jgi:hypothetical protein
MLAEHVGVDPQRHGGVCVAEAGGDYVVLLAAAASRSLPAVASQAIGFAESRPI